MNDNQQLHLQELKKITDEIVRKAEDEAEKLIADANTYATNALEEGKTQCNDIKAKFEEEKKTISIKILRNAEYQAKILKKQAELKLREKLSEKIIKETIRQLEQKTLDSDYKTVLMDWLIEACIGLNEKEVEIVASETEMKWMNIDFLKQIESQVENYSGLKVKLKKAAVPLFQKGPVARSLDGKISFSNQILTRVLRYKSEMLMMIQKSLFF